MNVSPKHLLIRLVAFLAGALVVGTAIVARGDSVRLHDQAAVRDASVTLAQVAELDGPAAEALGDTVVATLGEEQPFASVSLEAIRRALQLRGVNWADVTLAGYAACRVTRLAAEPPPRVDRDAAVASNPRDEVNLASTMTLRDLLMQKIEHVAGAPAAELRVAFDQRDAERLRRTVFGHRYEVVPHKERGLGRLLLRVRRYEMDRVAEQFTVVADVTRRALAAVATRNIARGEPFLAGAFEVREVYLDDAAVQPIADPKLLLSQTAFVALRQGAVITPDDLRSATMIRRGELVNVRCISGNLVVRVDARAMQDGALDEPIRLRNERSREGFVATVTGLRQAAFTIRSPDPAAGIALPQAAAP